MAKSFWLGMIALFGMVAAISASGTSYRSNFAKTHAEWSGYNEKHPVALSVVHENGLTALRFAPGGGTWNQPILDLPKPITVTALTMIRFKIKMPICFRHEMVIDDLTGKQSYELRFLVNSTDWVTVQRYLVGSVPKKAGGNGLLGHQINRITFALWGEPIELANVEIFESNGHDSELPVDTDVIPVKKYISQYKNPDYPVFKRNGVFPFGVVTRVDADDFNGKIFGVSTRDGVKADLADLRRHHVNTWLNFCDLTFWPDRLADVNDAGIYLLETMYSNADFRDAKQRDNALPVVGAIAKSPWLLAWYGHDEPLPGSYAAYIAEKEFLEKNDGKHPLTSAFNTPIARETLGKGMEVMIPDEYSIKPGLQDPAAPILAHFEIVRQVRKLSAGGNVWFMTQTFSQRSASGEYSWIYPTAAQIRLDMHTLAAAGADGIFFFIYNERIPFFISGQGEVFDYTLVDPWRNGNPVYDEIARFGETVVPVMPSLLDAQPSTKVTVNYDKKALLLGQSVNAFGSYFYFVNKSLAKSYEFTPRIPVHEGMKLYDLFTLAPAVFPLRLDAAAGCLLMLATPQNFATIKAEVEARKQQDAQSLEKLRNQELIAAGFKDGKPSAAWLQQEKELVEVRQGFGRIYASLVSPDHVRKVEADVNKKFLPLHEQLKALSREYFSLKQRHARGETIATAPLLSKIAALEREYGELLKGSH